MYATTTTLTHCLSNHFNWHQSRLECLSLFILSLFSCESVNLSKVSCRFGGHAKQPSHMKRLQRFISNQLFDYTKVSKLILELSGINLSSCIIAVDRTNWKFGALNINILVLGVVHGSLCIPVVFELLPKQGNSNTDERKKALEKLLKIIPASSIQCFLGDREFVGKEWLKLLGKKVPFCVRVKENFIATLPNKGTVQLSKRFCNLQTGKRKILKNILICGVPCHLAAMRLKSGELLLIAFYGIDETCPFFLY